MLFWEVRVLILFFDVILVFSGDFIGLFKVGKYIKISLDFSRLLKE